jgi:hypothetical protein
VLRKNHAIDPATLCEGGFEGMSKLQIFINKNKYLRWTPGSPIGVVAKSSRNASEPEDSAGLMGLTVIRALPGSKIDSRRPHFHRAKHALHRNMESERPRKRTKNFAADDSLPRTNNLTNKSRRLVKDLAWRSAGIADVGVSMPTNNPAASRSPATTSLRRPATVAFDLAMPEAYLFPHSERWPSG